ncbi:aspartate aminotransferase family protein [Aminithiophilus ramosus]|uniref:Aspartate aminotransferase family protein n=1 Tax=Aminithiophilus ramosus TaxID=3029084 RepID=A0A9Q7ADF4_9BACT|nr:aspartate aminotransferase family protein [Aminithiophilus ramosus]QTX31414.1 aspartate aminotransferase family protein [Aminithiophilus ramosus]
MDGKVLPRSFKTQAPIIVKGEGIYLEDESGRRYIDGCSGALISNLGHGCPEIIEAVTAQLGRIEFAHPSRWRTEATEEAAREVASMAPEGLDYVWFVSGGSEAIESAVKLARQYYVERDGATTSKAQVIARWNSYHGSTIGTMGLAGSMARRRLFSPLFLEAPKIAAHYCYRCPFEATYPSCGLLCARELEKTIRRIGPQYVSAFIAEPIVGSTVGALTPPEEYWPMIREVCDRYDILLIADEVMTGCGRTGANFCVDHWKVTPDIIVTAKGMAAGYVPTGGIIVRNAIAETLRDGSGAFLHGHTYNGNPLSGAATAAVFRYMKKHHVVENARAQGERLATGLRKIEATNPMVGEVRGKGLMWGVELVADRATRAPFPKPRGASALATKECLERGLVIYPGGGMIDGVEGDNFLIAPPLVATAAEIDEILKRLEEGLDAASKKLLS